MDDIAAADATETDSSPNPVAITVIFISSRMFSSITAPKMILASSSADFTNNRRRDIDLVERQVGSAGNVNQNALGALNGRFLQ